MFPDSSFFNEKEFLVKTPKDMLNGIGIGAAFASLLFLFELVVKCF